MKTNNVPENSPTWDVTYEQASHLIPNTLYNLLGYLLFDVKPVIDNDERVDVKQTEQEKILNLAQDILFANNVNTPKHVGLAVYVFHRTRSRDVITALSRLGHCVSYTNLQRILTTIALEMQSKTDKDQIYIPSNIIYGGFTHFAIDNLDFQENTLDGSSMHVTSMVMFQQSDIPIVQGGAIGAVPIKIGRRQTLQDVETGCFVSKSYGKGIKRKRRPDTMCLDPEWLLQQSIPDIQNIDLCWMLARLCQTKMIEVTPAMDSTVPSYKRFFAKISQCNLPVTAIGYIPFLPHSPNEAICGS